LTFIDAPSVKNHYSRRFVNLPTLFSWRRRRSHFVPRRSCRSRLDESLFCRKNASDVNDCAAFQLCSDQSGIELATLQACVKTCLHYFHVPPSLFLNDANRARTWCSHGNDRASYKQSEKSDESARYMLCSSWYFQPDPFSIFKFYSLWTWFASKPSSLSPYPRRTNLVLLWFRLSAQFVLFVCLFFSLKKFNFRLCKVILLTEHNNFQPCSTWLRCQVILTVYQALKRREIAQVS